MKAVAKHHVNYNGVWHKGGDEFEVAESEMNAMSEHCFFPDALSEEEADTGFVSEVFPPDPEDKPRRGRKKKAEE